MLAPATSVVLVSASPSLREWVAERLLSARNGEVEISGQDRDCPAQPGLVQSVAGFVVRTVKALGACCLQGEAPVLQGSALLRGVGSVLRGGAVGAPGRWLQELLCPAGTP